jgi:hypothetical protein
VVSELSRLDQAVDGRDPAVGLAAVAALRDLVEELEELHVDNARARVALAGDRRNPRDDPPVRP